MCVCVCVSKIMLYYMSEYYILIITKYLLNFYLNYFRPNKFAKEMESNE